jgi:RNA polymerase sigma factor (sigma-70 family)
VQQTWVLAWEKRHTYRATGDFVAWLARLCRTVCRLDAAREGRRMEVSLPENIAAETDSARSESSALELQDREDLLLNRIMALAPRQRQVLIAHFACGWTVKEISMHLGRSPETVKATIAQGLRRLRISAKQAKSEASGD